MPSPVVHLFSPDSHHDPQGIVGTREGLTRPEYFAGVAFAYDEAIKDLERFAL